MTHASNAEYKPGGGLATSLVVALVLLVVIRIVDVALTWPTHRVLDHALSGVLVEEAEFMHADTLAAMTALPVRVILAAAIALFLCWSFRVHGNLRALGIEKLQFSPLHAVGCYFLPVANLICPPQMMSEAWRASDPTLPEERVTAWEDRESTILIACWWAAVLLAFVFAGFSAMVFRRATPEAVLTAIELDACSALFTIVAAGLTLVLVRLIGERQDELAATLERSTSPSDIAPAMVALEQLKGDQQAA